MAKKIDKYVSAESKYSSSRKIALATSAGALYARCGATSAAQQRGACSAWHGGCITQNAAICGARASRRRASGTAWRIKQYRACSGAANRLQRIKYQHAHHLAAAQM